MPALNHLGAVVFEFAKDHAWLIPALPLLACVIIGVFGKWLKGAAHVPAWLAMIGSCILSLALLFGMSQGAIKPFEQNIFSWFSVGGLNVPVEMGVVQLTAMYLSFITGIGLLIFIYAAGYMKGDYGFWRFFAEMSSF